MRTACFALVALVAAMPAMAFVGGEPAAIIELESAATAPPPSSLQARFERVVPGGWTLEWDLERRVLTAGRRGRTPARRVAGDIGSTAEALTLASGFRAAVAPFTAGGPTPSLQLVRCEPWGRAWHVTWQQYAGALPILNARLDVTLVAASGDVVAFTSSLVGAPPMSPVQLDLDAATARAGRRLQRTVRCRSGERVVLAVAGELRSGWRLDVQGDRHDLRWDVVVAADDGTILRLDNRVRTLSGTCSADIVAAYANDIPAPVPLPWLSVTLDDFGGARTATSDATGSFEFFIEPAPTARLRAGLDGLYATVSNAVGAPRARVDRAVGSGTALHFDAASGRLDERTIYAHTNIIHDFVRTDFDFRLLDFPLPAVAGEQAYANAYWDGEGMHFGDGASTFFNLGLFADVIYHEYTHGITDYMYRSLGGLSGAQGAALHEALSDYFACTITGESRLGEGLYRNAPDLALRELDNMLQWPADRRGEEHADGEIFGGALWDLRQAVGATVADRLIHFARSLGPDTFEAYANAVLLQDDLQYGDGQAANGSPHRIDILTAFAAHGIGPAAGPGRSLVHVPLGDTEAVGEPRTVRAGFDGHASAINDSLVVEYSTGGVFVAQGMQRQPDGDFAFDLPAAALGDGVEVRYWIRTVARRGLPTQVLPAGAPAQTYGFRVGADVDPPQIDHAALGRALAIAWPATLSARIEDNLGIAAAWVETWQDGLPSAHLGLVRDVGDSNLWTTRFANVAVAGTVIDYRIVAVDGSRAGLTTCFPTCTTTLQCRVVAELEDDFESGSGGFTHASIRAGRGDAWQLAAPLDGALGRAWVCGGEAGAEYDPGLAAALVTPSLQLGTGARARVHSWIDAEPNAAIEAFDAAVVEIEVDGDGLWHVLAPTSGYTHTVAETGGANILPAGTPCLSGRDATWRQLEFDLAAWPSRRVRLRFVFAADTTPSSFGYRGWALDMFAVEAGTVDPTDSGEDLTPMQLQAVPWRSPGLGRVGLELRMPAPDAERLLVQLYDVRGAWIRDLWRGPKTAGVHRLEWDGADAGGLAQPAGVYYYRVDSRFGRASGKLVLLR